MRQNLLIRLITLFGFSLSLTTVNAQISASQTEGCAPLAGVIFTNSYSNPTDILWVFGDGASSTLPNPVKSYVNPGVFNVTFTAIVNGSPVEDNLTITVFENPTANFSVTPDGVCLGDELSFSDLSVGGSETNIVQWQWDFGNGITDNSGPNPSFTYTNPGSYQITLIVTDENGCEESSTVPGAAIVSVPPTMNITTNPNPPAACEAPLTVSFINNSTSNSPTGGGLTFDWNFGDGSTSDQVTPPPITYNDNGFFTITVTGTDNIGCSAIQNINVSVQEPTASVSAIGAEDGTVCSQVEFEVEGTTGGVFNYGDGSTGTSTTHIYAAEGDYTVTYSINVSGCSASATTSFFVEIPQATIVANPGFDCEIPAEFSYTLQSNYNIIEQEWTFNGEQGTEVNPENSLLPNPTTVFTYDDPNEFSINGLKRLFTNATFVTVNGCTGITTTNIDSVALPNALFYVDVDQGCAPLDVTFTNESSYIFPDNLVSAIWHFGDGNTSNTAADEDTDYTYNVPGEYEAFLVITTTEGCIDTSFVHQIEVGEALTPTFTINPTTICRDDSITLTNTSIDSGLIDAYSYSADLNTLSSCSNEENTTFAFNDFAGMAEITQFVDYNGCVSSSSQMVEVDGPVGKIHYRCDCETPFDYTFTAFDTDGNLQLYDADFWTWDFGDGTTITNSTATEVNHSYAATGDYEAILTTFSNTTSCGSHADTILIRVRDISATLSFDSLACVGINVPMMATELQDVAGTNGGCYRNYLWDFGDNTRPIKTLTGSVTHPFQNTGLYTVSLSVKDDNECVTTVTRDIDVFGVEANFEADTLIGCLPLEVSFTDLSIGDTALVDWQWNFDINGDGSDLQNPTYTFEDVNFDSNNNPIPYDVSLTVTDILGCVDDVIAVTVIPQAPNPEFDNSSSTNICVGDNVSFTPDANIPGFSYIWNYGNGTTSEGNIGVGTFQDAGTYTISLLVTDDLGCFREDSLVAEVNVQDFPIPIITTNFDEDEVLCYPFVATYTNASTGSVLNPNATSWNLEQVGTVNGPTAGTTYLEPGNFNVELSVSTTFGCTADTSITVPVEGPVAEITIDPLAICPGGTIEFTLSDTTDLQLALFDFGDGLVELTDQLETSHTYDLSTLGSTLLNVILYNDVDTSTACTFQSSQFLNIEPVEADFNRNNETSVLDSIHCFGIEDIFTSTSSPNATQFFWSIDGIPVADTQNFNTNLDPGFFNVELIVNSDLGCADTIAKNMEIFALPIPTSNGGEICQGETVELAATGGVSYSWSPTTGLDDPNSQIVQASPELSTNYIVTVIDTNDCSAESNSFVLVYQPPPSISADTTIIIGDTAITGFNLGGAFTYQWTPNIDIECDTCPVTAFRPLEDREYILSISDTVGCFTENSFFFFEIREVASVVVPDAFSPNGDGVNDIVFVEGWGIEELISFQIYNRWGELIFETSDQNEGWDGTYKGEIQNPDSYAYVITAKNFIRGNPETFKGFIDLIR